MLEINTFNWKDHVRRSLKAELVKRGITHEELSNLLTQIGVHETKAGIDSKIVIAATRSDTPPIKV